jgi:hypothetical protein
MPRVGVEPTIPLFDRAKTVHALDREATLIGQPWRTSRLYQHLSRGSFENQE